MSKNDCTNFPPSAIRVVNPDGGIGDLWPVIPREGVYREILEEVFLQHWNSVVSGPIIQGSAFEWRFRQAPRVGYLDGYLTVSEDGEHSPHFHVCVGEHHGTSYHPVSPELALWRKTSRAEFFRDSDSKCMAGSWGLRYFNGKDEQQLSVFFPNPHLDPLTMKHRQPDWSALNLWHDMRTRFANVAADALPNK